MMFRKTALTGMIGLCMVGFMMVGSGCDSSQASQPDGQTSNEKFAGEDSPLERVQAEQVAYEIVFNQDIQGEVQSEEGLGSLPADVRQWVKSHYKTETKDTKTADGSTFILVARGESSSSGYGIEVEEVSAENDTLHVRVKYTDPAEDEINLMVLTYPLLLLKVEGKYTEVKINVSD